MSVEVNLAYQKLNNPHQPLLVYPHVLGKLEKILAAITFGGKLTTNLSAADITHPMHE